MRRKEGSGVVTLFYGSASGFSTNISPAGVPEPPHGDHDILAQPQIGSHDEWRGYPGGAFGWERGGHFYETVFRIKSWKDRLPDAARWFGSGFAKGSLAGTQRDYLQRFIRETWRGELCHWAALACAPLFFLWNPW